MKRDGNIALSYRREINLSTRFSKNKKKYSRKNSKKEIRSFLKESSISTYSKNI